MGQFSQILLLVIDKAHTIPQKALDCILGLGGLNQVYEPNHPTPSACNKIKHHIIIIILFIRTCS